MQFLADYPLKDLTTFHVRAFAKLFAKISSQEDLNQLFQSKEFLENRHLILGGGSNVLFQSDFEGLVVKNKIQGKSLIEENDSHVFVKFGAGENWHDVVLYALANDWFGIENLSLIPGNVGAAPIQNIGAYGVELKDVFHELTAIDLKSKESKIYKRADCEFGYRNSLFKARLKGKIVITDVTLKLSKHPNVNLSYYALADYFKQRRLSDISPKEVSNAVIEIRQSKLPDPVEIGNGGSFFKNPIVGRQVLSKIKESYPHINYFENDKYTVKIPAAFLIQECGWKGKRFGDAGVHSKQPLVLVNHGNANGKEIAVLAQKIQKSVVDKFQIKLEPEVNII